MKTITVQELTRYVKNILENDHLLTNLWVKGEISNFKKASSGHIYFTLKDSYSCVRVVMFRSRARFLKCNLDNGVAVRVRGYVTVYERDGQYQLYAEEVEPDGTGALFVALEKLKQKLAAEGLFDSANKKKLPAFPRCVGIVTSPTGAAVRDMLNILKRRWPLIKIILAPVAVQGESAPGEVARAVSKFNELNNVDVIIVGRGGGSLEELWAFNTEIVARTIAGSAIPVISAVGHETDFSIADLVADLRAPTPSAAAEMVVPDCREIKRMIDTHRVRLTRCVRQQISGYRQRLQRCAESRVLARPVACICDQRRQTVDLLEKQLYQGARSLANNQGHRLALLAGRLDALSPLSTLSRGYSYTTGPGGAVLRDAGQVSAGDPISVHLYRGLLKCSVREVMPERE
ncbi:exodeoxyribonuclease VII large subunit [Desulfoscipio geothermicus]|uniref:Exodeoxyribonuclease 7 large subunit n=1 Tax=Desulfoscipio geothermicus DSM 3669 TaxID=1121426 RepID=A0A1I6DB10_9FIRM|nr:exodeoxyribonuclease VII large subunit [Desulfoscipio geothermicus]SFR02619.1 Exodeoxyribonuclease VII large subunit [Desulfoscipio geothermicus DSM 3669]